MADAFVNLAAAAAQQVLVRNIAHQRVTEAITGFGRPALAQHEARIGQARNAARDIGRAFDGHDLEQRLRELEADDRGYLGDFLCRSEPVEACHQRILQCCRHDGSIGALRLGNRFGQLFDEERIAVRLGHDLVDQRRLERPRSSSLGNEVDTFLLREARQDPRRSRSSVRPQWRIFGSGGNEREDARFRDAVDQTRHQLLCRRVYPVRILEDEENRLLNGKRGHLIDERGDGCGFALSGREPEGRIPVIGWNRKQVGHEARRCGGVGPRAREKRFQFLELARGGILERQAGPALEMPDDRVQRAVRVIRRTLAEHPEVRLFADILGQSIHDARLPHARVALQ